MNKEFTVYIMSSFSSECRSQEGQTSTIKTLLELGADLYARDKKGRSGERQTQLSRDSCCVEIVKWLSGFQQNEGNHEDHVHFA